MNQWAQSVGDDLEAVFDEAMAVGREGQFTSYELKS